CGRQRRRVAHVAVYVAELGPAVGNGRWRRVARDTVGRRGGLIEESHKVRKAHYVARDLGARVIEIGVVFGRPVEQTGDGGRIGRESSLALKHLVAYALLHVVGFAGEKLQRLVLRLPPESSDGAVVAVSIGVAGDAQGLFER